MKKEHKKYSLFLFTGFLLGFGSGFLIPKDILYLEEAKKINHETMVIKNQILKLKNELNEKLEQIKTNKTR